MLRTEVADEGVPVTVLEVGHRDDVTLEARHRRYSKVATTRQVEDQLLAGRYRLSYKRRRRDSSSGCAAEVVEFHRALLRSGAKWVKRSVRDCDTRVKPGLLGYEREQQIASTQI